MITFVYFLSLTLLTNFKDKTVMKNIRNFKQDNILRKNCALAILVDLRPEVLSL